MYINGIEYPHVVVLNNDLEMEKHHEILSWCSDHFGISNVCKTFRPALPGSPSRYEPLFSTWLFTKEEDATLFKLTWL